MTHEYLELQIFWLTPISENLISLGDTRKLLPSVKWVPDCVHKTWKAKVTTVALSPDQWPGLSSGHPGKSQDLVLQVRWCLSYSSCSDDKTPWLKGERKCLFGLMVLEVSPSWHGRQRQRPEADCHTASAVKEQRMRTVTAHLDLSFLSSPGKSSAQWGASSHLDWPHQDNRSPSQACPEAVSLVFLDPAKLTLLPVIFGSWK